MLGDNDVLGDGGRAGFGIGELHPRCFGVSVGISARSDAWIGAGLRIRISGQIRRTDFVEPRHVQRRLKHVQQRRVFAAFVEVSVGRRLVPAIAAFGAPDLAGTVREVNLGHLVLGSAVRAIHAHALSLTFQPDEAR